MYGNLHAWLKFFSPWDPASGDFNCYHPRELQTRQARFDTSPAHRSTASSIAPPQLNSHHTLRARCIPSILYIANPY